MKHLLLRTTALGLLATMAPSQTLVEGTATRMIDLDRDGRLDRMVVTEKGLSIAWNDGGRHFGDVRRFEVPGTVSVLVDDLDGDGAFDLYLVTSHANRALLGDGRREFVEMTRELGLLDEGVGIGAQRLDIDGDGHVDLLLQNTNGDVVFWGAPEGSFTRDVSPTRVARNEPTEPAGGVPVAPAHAATPTPGDAPATEPTPPAQASTRRTVSTQVASVSSIEDPTVRTNGPLGRATAPGVAGAAARPLCALTLRDVSTGDCVSADSTPTLGRLYPLSSDFNLDPAGNVGIGTTTPGARLTVNGSFIRTVARATGLGPNDDTDDGRLMSRTLVFEKKRDDTAVRVAYTDNFRVLGASSGSRTGRWEIRANGAAPPGGAVYFDFYTWMSISATRNSHRSGTLIGYLEGLPAGSHSIEIWVGPTPGGYAAGDLYTGWNSTRWTLEAEEVF